MSLEHLVETLTREAEAEAAAIIAAARAEAADVTARSSALCAGARESARASRESARRAAVDAALTEARRETRRVTLEARRRVLDRVFAAARAALPSAVERAEYRAAVPQELEIAIACLGGRAATLRCHPSLQAQIEPLARARTGIAVVADAGAGSGFRLATADGSLEIDATLENRLDRHARRIEIEVNQGVGSPT